MKSAPLTGVNILKFTLHTTHHTTLQTAPAVHSTMSTAQFVSGSTMLLVLSSTQRFYQVLKGQVEIAAPPLTFLCLLVTHKQLL